jgi:predicted  nucleic acid-binding Zn-ribbon protein
MRDTKPLLLILLSIGLISTWVYHIYDKAQYTQQPKTEATDKETGTEPARDSLRTVYAAMVSQMGDSLTIVQTTAEDRLKEINVLKNEIRALLGKENFTKIDKNIAEQKITQLQEKIDELNGQKENMEEERAQLNTILSQLTQNVDTLQRSIRRLSNENEALNEKVSLASIFVASEVKIDAIEVKGVSEEPTSQAKKTDKFVASFVVQNRVNQFSNAELTTVLLRPDGQVMQSTVWDSGSFDTKSEGRKNFTRKIRFDYEKGEQKNLLFTIDTDKCQKGTYTFQLWHNGVMIGQAKKTLS